MLKKRSRLRWSALLREATHPQCAAATSAPTPAPAVAAAAARLRHTQSVCAALAACAGRALWARWRKVMNSIVTGASSYLSTVLNFYACIIIAAAAQETNTSELQVMNAIVHGLAPAMHWNEVREALRAGACTPV
jgi:hypothetical protein